MSSVFKRFKQAIGVSRSDDERRRAAQRERAQREAETRSRQRSNQLADDARARSRQIQIKSEREADRAEAIARSEDIQSQRSERANTARSRFRRRGSRSTILTSSRGLSGGARAPVRRRQLFSVLGEGGTRSS